MFKWMKQPIASAENFNPADYTFEGDGHFLAFEEAFADLAAINEEMASVNVKGINAFAEAWHNGGQKAAMEAANAFANGPVMEGFIGDAWQKLKDMLKKLWEKIKAFFHSARQYFDAFFLSGKKFAEKYEDELDKVELDKFKYKVYDWKLDKVKSKSWTDVEKEAVNAAKKAGVAIKESYGISDGRNSWVAAIEGILYNPSTKQWAKIGDNEPSGLVHGWKSDMSKDNIDHFNDKNGWSKVPAMNAVTNWGSGSSSSEGSGSSSSEGSGSTVDKMSASQRKQVVQILCNAIAGGSKGTIDGMKKELAKEIRGGKSEPREKEISSGDISSFVSALKDGEEEDDIKQWEDDMNSSFEDIMDKLKDIDSKDNPDLKQRVKNQISVFTIGKDVAMAVFSVFTAAIKERNNQYKSCLSAALHYSAPKD